ncbi:uncharacterized protein [Gossypium hirsutum]|uniref:Retrovirus-related Pol polyprotein from transposon TNT 1-94-like beta-barrel domain-containing protein n=1 Tax=Gossypium hirsutum TaxID=3635 RepID=A0ABM2ZQ14_GOSHI|nr:uncharacterized protein LOC121214718 [Gossypium hirsutum]
MRLMVNICLHVGHLGFMLNMIFMVGPHSNGPIGGAPGMRPTGSIGDDPAHDGPLLLSTKLCARVYNRSDPCIGLPRLGKLCASDYSDSPGSLLNTAQVESNGGDDSYVPVNVGTTSWYPDSGASHHVCRNVSALHDATPYLGMSSLLMGDGSPAVISLIGNAIIPTPSKSLCLSNVLCVPSIRKNLLSVSQSAHDNGVFF